MASTRRQWTRWDLLAIPGLALIITALVMQFVGGFGGKAEGLLGVGIVCNTAYLLFVRLPGR